MSPKAKAKKKSKGGAKKMGGSKKIGTKKKTARKTMKMMGGDAGTKGTGSAG